MENEQSHSVSIEKFKYPKTLHLPFSPSMGDGDRMMEDDSQFWGKRVVASVKMDGENTTVYPDGTCHSRSLENWGRKWQSWMSQYARTWCHGIPKGWRVCGEDLYPRHSIGYRFPDKSYFFQVFGIYNEKNECLSIEEELEWCELLGLRHVPIFYRGMYCKEDILLSFDVWKEQEKAKNGNETEGFILRLSSSFPYADFSKSTGKYVRQGHVQTDGGWATHWKPNEVVRPMKDN